MGAALSLDDEDFQLESDLYDRRLMTQNGGDGKRGREEEDASSEKRARVACPDTIHNLLDTKDASDDSVVAYKNADGKYTTIYLKRETDLTKKLFDCAECGEDLLLEGQVTFPAILVSGETKTGERYFCHNAKEDGRESVFVKWIKDHDTDPFTRRIYHLAERELIQKGIIMVR